MPLNVETHFVINAVKNWDAETPIRAEGYM